VNYIIHTFHLETKLQYFGLNQEDTESLAPLFLTLNILCWGSRWGKCELRDVMHSMLFSLLSQPISVKMVFFCIDTSCYPPVYYN